MARAAGESICDRTEVEVHWELGYTVGLATRFFAARKQDPIQHSAASGEAAYRLTNHYRLQVVIGTIIAEIGGVRFSYGAQEHVKASDPSWHWSGVYNVCFNDVMCTHLLLEVMGCFAVIIQVIWSVCTTIPGVHILFRWALQSDSIVEDFRRQISHSPTIQYVRLASKNSKEVCNLKQCQIRPLASTTVPDCLW